MILGFVVTFDVDLANAIGPSLSHINHHADSAVTGFFQPGDNSSISISAAAILIINQFDIRLQRTTGKFVTRLGAKVGHDVVLHREDGDAIDSEAVDKVSPTLIDSDDNIDMLGISANPGDIYNLSVQISIIAVEIFDRPYILSQRFRIGGSRIAQE